MKSREISKIWRKNLVRQSEVHTAYAVLEFGNGSEYDPFILMMEDRFRQGAFDKHPHRGMETVTYIISGVLEHYDSAGNSGRLEQGDVQWMTAGSGVIHLESPPAEEEVHLLQLWVNLPRTHKMTNPRNQQFKADELPVRSASGVTVRVYSGTSGEAQAPTLNYTPVTMLEINMESGASFFQELPESYSGFMFILQGSGEFGDGKQVAEAGQVLQLGSGSGTDGISLLAKEQLRILLYAGEPLNEPVVARGPFVMNTEEEIAQAYSDFRSGKFITPAEK